MNMKDHILAALQDQFNRWEELLAALNEDQITAPHFDFDWSIKDVIAHLWAWQQISIARVEGGLHDREPKKQCKRNFRFLKERNEKRVE